MPVFCLLFFILLELVMDIFCLRRYTNDHNVVSLTEKRRVAHRETTFLDTIFNAQLFLCATPTPRIEILSEKPLNTIYSAGVSVVSTLPLTLTPTVTPTLPLETLGFN